MATKKKLTDLNSTADLATEDVVHIVDVSDTAQDPAGSSKKTTLGDVGDYLGIPALEAHVENTNNPHEVTKAQVGLGNADDTSDANKPVSTATQTALDAKINNSEKAANNGVATLDAGGKIPASQLPSTVMDFKGTWDASTNTPELANGDGNAGDVYMTSVAGSVDFGAGVIAFEIGDWAVYNGSEWQKSINSNKVVSVNGQQGVVVLDKSHLGLANVDNTSDANKPVSIAAQAALDLKASISSLASYALLTGRAGGQTLVGGTGVSDALILQGTSADGTATAIAYQVRVGNNGATIAMTVRNNGYIGFGTDVPSRPYTFSGSIASPNQPLVLIEDISAGAGSRDILQIKTAAAAAAVRFTNDTSYWRWLIGSNEQLRFDSETTVGAFNITQSGNTGIGALTPASKLNVAGGTAIGSGYGTTVAPTDGLIVEGSLGVGVTTPEEKLHVSNAAGTGSMVLFENGTTNVANFGAFGGDSSTVSFNRGLGGSRNIRFYDGNTAIVMQIVGSTGRVGINNGSPSSRLDVLDTSEQLRLTYGSGIYTSFLTDSSGNLTVTPTGGNTTVNGNLYVDTSSGSKSIGSFNTSRIMVSPSAANGLRLYDTAGETMRLVSGNVGIGTTTPTTRLSISDSGANGLLITGANGNEVARLQAVSGSTNRGELILKEGTTGTEVIKLTSVSGADNYFNNAGNVGIGVTAPANPLEIYRASQESLIQVRSNLTTYTGIGFRESTVSGADMGFIGIKRTDSPSSGDSEIHLRNSQSGVMTSGLVISTAGNVSIGHVNADTILDINGALTLRGLGAAPTDPDDGAGAVWIDTATGDLKTKITFGGVTKIATVIDFSAV